MPSESAIINRPESFTPKVEPKTRVLFLNTRSGLGADVMVHMTLIQNFDPEQVEVHVATNRNSRDLQPTLDILYSVPGLRARTLVLDLGNEVSRTSGGKLGKLVGALRNLTVLPALARVAAYIKRHKIDIIHSTDRPRDALFASLLARMTGCRNVMHVHIKWDSGIGRAARWAVGQCAGVIAISDYTRQSILAAGIDGRKVYTCLNSSDARRFDPDKAAPGLLREQFQIDPCAPLIGLVARIMMWKGHLELVEAFSLVKKEIPEAVLVIVGLEDRFTADLPDSFGAKVRARIVELNLQESIFWAGWHDDMPRVMRDLDLLCVPSWEEPFGLVCTEAMAMRRPVVGFHAGGLPEILTDGVEGRLVPPRDTTLLADALIQLTKDPALRTVMGAKGRDRVCTYFSPRRQADEMADIYRKIRS